MSDINSGFPDLELSFDTLGICSSVKYRGPNQETNLPYRLCRNSDSIPLVGLLINCYIVNLPMSLEDSWIKTLISEGFVDKTFPSPRTIRSTNLYRCKLSDIYFGLMIICAVLAAPCHGAIIITPEHFIAETGSTKDLTCISDITDYEVYWFWSGGRQRSLMEVYDGAVPETMKAKFNVSEEVKDSYRGQSRAKRSTFTIRNISMTDGGTIYCTDDGGFGVYHPIRIFVIKTKPVFDCSYDGNTVNVTLSYCYWGEESLYVKWNSSLTNSCGKNESYTEYNETDRCMQYTSVLQFYNSEHLEASAELVDESSHRSVASYDLKHTECYSQFESTERASQSSNLKPKLTTPMAQQQYNGQQALTANKHLSIWIYIPCAILHARL